MNQITINPNIRFGKPCVNGTRLAVEDILNMLKAGWTVDEVTQEYPELTKKDILGAIDFACELIKEPANVVDMAFTK